jgi:two-component system, chemotaxis family, protein-glutamate methylesterase/glutaminase
MADTSQGNAEAHVPVIALVASAGGLDAVTRVLTELPGDLPACVLVLIHQAPERVNELVGILSRRCALPVRAAADDVPLAAGEVAVVPPGTHLLVTAGRRTALITSGAAPPSRPSADLLLTTLATAVGPAAIAVVLSGGGHDGATGATAIHKFGGTVIASDEASSSSFSMPLATIKRDHAVDHIVDLDEIAALLGSIIAEGASPV